MSRPEAPHPDDERDVFPARRTGPISVTSSTLSENFDIDVVNTDARLKLKKKLGPVRLGANCTFDCPRENGADNVEWEFTLRPAFPRQNLASTVLNKLKVQPRESMLRWSMGTLSWRFAKLKLEGSYDWETKRFAYNYRVMTALHNDSDSAFHKKTVAWNNRVKVQPRYDWDLNFPSVQGGNQSNRKVDPFMVRFGLKVVDTVINLDRRPDSFFSKKKGTAFNLLGPFGEPDAKVQIITVGQPVRSSQNQEVIISVKDKSMPQKLTPAPPAPSRAASYPTPAASATRPILTTDGRGLRREDVKRKVWDPIQRFAENPVRFVKEHPIKLPWLKSRD